MYDSHNTGGVKAACRMQYWCHIAARTMYGNATEPASAELASLTCYSCTGSRRAQSHSSDSDCIHIHRHRLNGALMRFNFLGPPEPWYRQYSLTQISLTGPTTQRAIHKRKDSERALFKQLAFLHSALFHRNTSSVRHRQGPRDSV